MLDKQRIGTFVLGGIAGALAGILLAPRSGKELRGSITSRAGEARERGRETYFEAQERVQERVSRTREYPFAQGEPRFAEESDADPLVGLGLSTPEPEVPFEEPPPLRDVSRQESSSREIPGTGSPDAEEIRRRVQETRSRLRARLEAPEDRDE